MTKDELQAQMVAAMKAKDKTRLSIIRQVMGEVKNLEVDERRDATEEDVDRMIKRLIKQTGEIHSDWTGVKLDVDAYRKVVYEPYDLRVREGTIDF